MNSGNVLFVVTSHDRMGVLRNRKTGIIERGVVVKTYGSGFDYMLNGNRLYLDYDVIGKRLFFTWKGAWQNYKKQKDG